MRQPQGLFTPYDITEPRGLPDRSTAVRAIMVQFEDEVRGASVEHAAAFDAGGRLLLRKLGQPDRVGYTDAELKGIQGSHLTHNHPNGASFSIVDVRLAAFLGLAELRAVGPQFRHIMFPRRAWPTDSDIKTAVDSVSASAIAEVDRQVTEGLSPAFHSLELTHQVWVRAARRLGLRYVREYT